MKSRLKSILRSRLFWIALAVLAVVAGTLVHRYAFMREGVTPSEEEYPVRGIDISSHNGDIDFGALKQAGIDFVLIKASEGSSFKDPRFYTNIARARKAGLKVSAYHFFFFFATGYMQALNFLHSLRGQQLDMPAVIDIEHWTNPNNRTTTEIRSTLSSLIHELESAGVPVMLYSNRDGYDEFIRGRLERYPVWFCTFGEIDADIRWCFWQYSHRGHVEGIDGRVDLDVFNGSRAEWEKWCAAHSTIIQ